MTSLQDRTTIQLSTKTLRSQERGGGVASGWVCSAGSHTRGWRVGGLDGSKRWRCRGSDLIRAPLILLSNGETERGKRCGV